MLLIKICYSERTIGLDECFWQGWSFGAFNIQIDEIDKSSWSLLTKHTENDFVMQ